ncbi:MAG: type VI secretion system baseplate subunit TssG, partial [Pirellula sp.]
PLPLKERTSLRRNNQLGRSSVLGERIPDRQSNIDIKIGPVDQTKFRDFLPGSDVRNVLRDIVRGHSGLSIDARVTVSVVRKQSDAVSLGNAGQLGRTAWIGGRECPQTRDDYSFDLHAVGKESNSKRISETTARRAA